jgi:hypothetical protein
MKHVERFPRALRRGAAIGAAAMLSFLSAHLLAKEPAAPIGHVKTVSGEAWVGARDAAVAARPGLPIHVGAVMRTGRSGTLGVTLKDNTVMSFGPDTEVVVDDYLFDPGRGGLKLGASITRGTMNFISGMIAKLRPDAQTVRTPTGTIGVRGTQFMVKVDDVTQPATVEHAPRGASSHDVPRSGAAQDIGRPSE